MTSSRYSRLPRGRVGRPVLSGRTAALNSGSRCVRRCAHRSAHVVTRSLLGSFSPVPPASQNGRGTARTVRPGGQTGEIHRRRRTGSANNSWFPRDDARKSLILEVSTAIKLRLFAMSYRVFATSLILMHGLVASLFSLSKLLKKKKKEGFEEAGIRLQGMPRVIAVLPSISVAAYFLGHELAEQVSLIHGNSWQSILHRINTLRYVAIKTTCPLVALRVPPPRTYPEARR